MHYGLLPGIFGKQEQVGERSGMGWMFTTAFLLNGHTFSRNF